MNDTTLQSAEDRNDGIMKNQLQESDQCGYITLIVFLIEGIGVSLVSAVGICGNILCFIIISRPSMRSSTNILLLGLSVFDFVFVCMVLFMRGVPLCIRYFCVDSFESFYLTTLDPIFQTYLFPPYATGQLGSTYFTVLVSMERCFVVYRPLLARPYCTSRNAVRASLLTVLFTTLFTLPFWFEFRLESVYDESGSWTNYRTRPLLFKNQNYNLYYGYWLSMFVYRIIPPTLLTFLNIAIYWKVREAKKAREAMTQVTSSDISLAKMLMWIVSIYLLCNLCSLAGFVRDLMDLEENAELAAVGVFLLTLNSTVNFLIYSVKTKKFRRVALELFCPNKWRGGRSNNVPMNHM